MCNVTIVPRHKRHNSSHSKQHITVRIKSEQTTHTRSSGFTPQPPFWQSTRSLQAKLCTSNTLSRHKVAATKTHKGSTSNHSKQYTRSSGFTPRPPFWPSIQFFTNKALLLKSNTPSRHKVAATKHTRVST